MKTRIISACVFVPVILLAVFFGGWIFAALMLAIAVIGGYEYGKIAKAREYTFLPAIYYPSAVLLIVLAQLFPAQPGTLLGVLFLAFGACLTMFILGRNRLDDVTYNLTGIVYIPVMLSTAVLMRSGMENGMFLIYLLLVIEWFTDSGAYLIGRKIGRHKLMPKVSPKKSVEGAVGGIVCALIGAVVLNAIVPMMPVWLMLVAALIVSVGGQLGDLCESAFKRWAGVKDSGTLIPGHGGILDRFDSMLFAAPLLYLILSVFLQFGA